MTTTEKREGEESAFGRLYLRSPEKGHQTGTDEKGQTIFCRQVSLPTMSGEKQHKLLCCFFVISLSCTKSESVFHARQMSLSSELRWFWLSQPAGLFFFLSIKYPPVSDQRVCLAPPPPVPQRRRRSTVLSVWQKAVSAG